MIRPIIVHHLGHEPNGHEPSRVKTATGTRQQATAIPGGKETIEEIVKICALVLAPAHSKIVTLR
jgi:hypothetical protein